MIDLKEYISGNPEAFDDQELPLGHETRFEAKLDALLEVEHKTEVKKTSGKRRRFTRIFSATASIAAAVAAAVIFINRPAEEIDWFAGVADDPVAVYLAYSEKVSSMYGEILTRDLEYRWGTTVSSIAEEAVPIIDQLPQELDDASKAIILKEYYGKLLNGLDKINKIKEL